MDKFNELRSHFLDKHNNVVIVFSGIIILWYFIVLMVLAPLFFIAWMGKQSVEHKSKIGYVLCGLLLAVALDYYIRRFFSGAIDVANILHRLIGTSKENINLGSFVFALFIAFPLTTFSAMLDLKKSNESTEESSDSSK